MQKSVKINEIIHKKRRREPRRRCDLQFAVAHGTGEGDGVPDVANAGQIHDTALKAQAETGVAGRAVLAQIHVEAVVLGFIPSSSMRFFRIS